MVGVTSLFRSPTPAGLKSTGYSGADTVDLIPPKGLARGYSVIASNDISNSFSSRWIQMFEIG
jgi:hypothetical protein